MQLRRPAPGSTMAKPRKEQHLWDHVASFVESRQLHGRHSRVSSPSTSDRCSDQVVEQMLPQKNPHVKPLALHSPKSPQYPWPYTMSSSLSSIKKSRTLASPQKSLDIDSLLEEEQYMTEPAAEPGWWVEEPAAEPRRRHRHSMSQTLCAALVLVVARLVWRAQRHSLHHWHHVARMLPRPVFRPPQIELSEVQDALACRAIVGALRKWRHRVDMSQVRQAVIVFCHGHRAQVLLARTFRALVRQWQAFRYAVEAAERMRQQWSEPKLMFLAESVMESWRHEAFEGARCRRAEHALLEWVRITRLRAYTHAWLVQARRCHEINMKMRRKEEALRYRIGLKFCSAWHRLAGLSQLSRRRAERKVKQIGVVAWEVWWSAVWRARRASQMANYRRQARKRKFMRSWSKLERAVAFSMQYFRARSFRHWRRLLIVINLGRKLQKSHNDQIESVCFIFWHQIVKRAKQAAGVSLRRGMGCARSALRQWFNLGVAIAAHKICLARACIELWDIRREWCLQVRAKLVAQNFAALGESFQAFLAHCKSQKRKRRQEASLIEKCTNSNQLLRCGQGLKWWRQWSSQRRHRELDISKHEDNIQGQSKQRSLRDTVQRWRKFSQGRRVLRLKDKDATSKVRAISWKKAVWSWNAWAVTSRDDRQRFHRNTLALRAMLATSEWATAAEACDFWAAWAKESRARKKARLQKRIHAVNSAASHFADRQRRKFGARALTQWRIVARAAAGRLQQSIHDTSTTVIWHRCVRTLFHWSHWSKRRRRQQPAHHSQQSAQVAREHANIGHHGRKSDRSHECRSSDVQNWFETQARACHKQGTSQAHEQLRQAALAQSSLSNGHSSSFVVPGPACNAPLRQPFSASSVPPQQVLIAPTHSSGRLYTETQKWFEAQSLARIKQGAPQGRFHAPSSSVSVLTDDEGSLQGDSLTFSEGTSRNGTPFARTFGNKALPGFVSTNGRALATGRQIGRPEVEIHWLRWTIALWLGAVAALPWLQWSFSLWRGALLRAELTPLRWWSLAADLASVAQNAKKAVARKQQATEKQLLTRHERISEAAWSSRLLQLAVLHEWAGATTRHAMLNQAVSKPNPCKLETLQRAFSAWVLLVRRRCDAALAAKHIEERAACHGSLALADAGNP